jgi:hypothetical protein
MQITTTTELPVVVGSGYVPFVRSLPADIDLLICAGGEPAVEAPRNDHANCPVHN